MTAYGYVILEGSNWLLTRWKQRKRSVSKIKLQLNVQLAYPMIRIDAKQIKNVFSNISTIIRK